MYDRSTGLNNTWNARNQLASMTGDFSGSFSETYDAFGRRETSADSNSNETITLLHDGAGLVGWSGSLGDSWTFLTIPGGGALAGTYSNGNTTYVPLMDAEGLRLRWSTARSLTRFIPPLPTIHTGPRP